jgi:uncharacterized protein YceK
LKLIIAAALVAALTLSGCAGLATSTTPAPATPGAATTLQLIAAKAAYAPEVFYNVAAKAYLAAAPAMPAATKASAKCLVDGCTANGKHVAGIWDAVTIARAADTMGDQTTVLAQAGAIAALVIKLEPLIPGLAAKVAAIAPSP